MSEAPAIATVAVVGAGTIRRVAVVGAGTMGPGIAATMARAGLDVRLTDTSQAALDRAPSLVAQATEVLDRLGVPAKAGGAVAYPPQLADAVSEADLVLENVPERLELKRAVLAEVAPLVSPACILASDTSGIPITRLQEGMAGPERFVGMHWSNPPHLMPVIEVVKGALTDDATVTAVTRLALAVGHRPILVAKDVPGFVENRILYAVMREAVDLVEQGVIEPEALDALVSWGIGLKLAVVGPMALLDMAGLDIYGAVSAYLNAELADRKDTAPLIRAKLEAGRLGLKSGAGIYAYAEGEPARLGRERAARLVAMRLALEEAPP